MFTSGSFVIARNTVSNACELAGFSAVAQRVDAVANEAELLRTCDYIRSLGACSALMSLVRTVVSQSKAVEQIGPSGVITGTKQHIDALLARSVRMGR